MNKYQFSRYAGLVADKYIKGMKQRMEFIDAIELAIFTNPENPLEVLDSKYKILFSMLDEVRHLPGKHAQKSHGGGRGGGSSKMTAKKAANQVATKAVAAEPVITQQMQDLAAANGGQMIGLDFRLKTEESLERKIADKARDEFGGDYEAAAADIGDSVRYTMELNPNNYGNGVRSTIDSLNEQGYQTRVKNYWQEGNIYKGVNATITSPDGQKFELQFHTRDSFNLKETFNHKLYEEHRLSTTSAARKFELEQQMANNWLSVSTPENLDLLATISKPVLQLPSRPIQ